MVRSSLHWIAIIISFIAVGTLLPTLQRKNWSKSYFCTNYIEPSDFVHTRKKELSRAPRRRKVYWSFCTRFDVVLNVWDSMICCHRNTWIWVLYPLFFKLFILSNTKRGYGDIEYIQVPAKVCSPAINWSMINLRNTALRAHAIKGRLVLCRYCFQIKLLLLHSMHCRRKPILWLWIPVKGTHQEANIHFQNAI